MSVNAWRHSTPPPRSGPVQTAALARLPAFVRPAAAPDPRLPKLATDSLRWR